MRHDETDKPKKADDTDSRSRQQRRYRRQEDAGHLHMDPQALGHIVPQGEDIQIMGTA